MAESPPTLDRVLRVFRREIAGLGRTGGLGMPGTVNDRSVHMIFRLLNLFLDINYPGRPFVFVDVGADTGRMLYAALSQHAVFASGCEVAAADPLKDVFEYFTRELGCRDSINIAYDMDITSIHSLRDDLNLFPLRPDVDMSNAVRVVYAFDDGFNTADRRHTYRLCADDARVVTVFSTKAATRGMFADYRDILGVLNQTAVPEFVLDARFSVHLRGSGQKRWMFMFSRRGVH
jgi:hypothetical protein